MEGMWTTTDLIVAAGVAALIVLALILVAMWRRDRRDPVRDELMDLSTRLSQLSAGQLTAQNQISERLQAQERALGKALNDRLETVSRRVSETLEKSGQRQNEALVQLRERLARIDEAQRNIVKLSSQVDGLREIFVDKRARGAFGEIQLKDLIEKVLPPSAYRMQATVNGNYRVDCLLQLPNPPGPICVDAKFPLEPYHAIRDATDEAAQKAAAALFTAAIRKHIQDIASKYIVPGETAESALMFLPSEAVYAELHANFPDLVEASYRARVFIVSPTTLWAMLNTIRAVLQDVQMREQAGLIQAEVQKMMEDVVRLDERVGKLQRHFDQAGEDMRQVRISSEKVTVRGERIMRLEAEEPDAALPEPPPE
ncbi:MAG: DNA recombination protein RmuC [Alphaproteobacteria bacterium]|nr:DNA recombination protein RmuC [Alphaproteobacteria bacterium]